ncbi:MAG TPA: DUF5807 family protein [Halobacteriales archaeon]|nr:DUF5807 family protein [Halobacteriales archaeon]
MTARDAFLAGERPGDVAIFLADAHLRNAEALADLAERVEGGYVLVVDGERGRRLFPKVAGGAPMEFAQEATKREGAVDRDLTGGTCPDAEGDGNEEHAVRFVLAFAQEQTDDVGGPYEEGDVIHAYARCACGVAYSDRWVVGDDAEG